MSLTPKFDKLVSLWPVAPNNVPDNVPDEASPGETGSAS